MGENRKIAKYDYTYCTCNRCKEKCWRHVDNYIFKNDGYYSFMECCEKERGINDKKTNLP